MYMSSKEYQKDEVIRQCYVVLAFVT